ncbi:MAG TPA: hypothetical protein ENJ47_02010, partial [Candidatus Acetothermia bacterium]|nr:hypothetical protein [Candidatus Acetothermia bacterium]
MVVLSLVSPFAFGYERGEFLFLDQIKVGMSGIGKTVVAGDVISEFHVDVLGVIDQPGDLSDFIVVRVSGEAIGRSGGIAQGMSGSPIYIDGKLIGALSRAAAWSKAITPIGLVTPIEVMLPVLDRADLAHRPEPDAVLSGVELAEVGSPPDPEAVAQSPDTIFAYPVSTPIITAGLSGRALQTLMNGEATRPKGLIGDFIKTGIVPEPKGLSAFDLSLIPVSGSAGSTPSDPSTLVPGSPIGVALTTGDVSIGGLGTLTYRDGDALVAFGHTFIYNGASSFPLTTASVIDTMKAYDASFKLGTLGPAVGAILEDRISGIGGRIGKEANGIDLDFKVTDADIARTESYDIEVVDEPRLMPELLLSTGFDAIDSTLDRIGQGTVVVDYEIEGDGMPTPLKRRDVFISTRDVALYPPWQLAEIVVILQYNEFEDPKLTRISASMEIAKELRAIMINRLSIDSYVYAPGDEINFEVKLQTYQGKAEVQ